MFFYSFLELQAGPREPARSRLIPKARDDLVGCTICGRNFAEDRIEKHQEICMKSQSKKRKTFDMAKKRLQGTDAETFALKPKRGGARVSKVSPQIIPSFSNYLTVLVLVSAIFTEISLTCKFGRLWQYGQVGHLWAPMAIWSSWVPTVPQCLHFGYCKVRLDFKALMRKVLPSNQKEEVPE